MDPETITRGTITAEELLAPGGTAVLRVDPEDLAQVNLLANVMDKITRARLRDMDGDERAKNLIPRADFDAALSSIYSTVESECGPRLWVALSDAGADYEQAREVILEMQDRIYQRFIAYGATAPPAE